MRVKPNVICIQESWLSPKLDFVIKGYTSIRRDREAGKGGGVITFIQKGIQYRDIKRGDDLEFTIVEVWSKEGNIDLINFYNPCRQLQLSQLADIWKDTKGRVIWCGEKNMDIL